MRKILWKNERTWIACSNYRVVKKICDLFGPRCIGIGINSAGNPCVLVDVSDYICGTWYLLRFAMKACAGVLGIFLTGGYAIRSDTVRYFAVEP